MTAVWLQVGFFEIVGVPLYRNFAAVFQQARPLLDGMADNLSMWRSETLTPKSRGSPVGTPGSLKSPRM